MWFGIFYIMSGMCRIPTAACLEYNRAPPLFASAVVAKLDIKWYVGIDSETNIFLVTNNMDLLVTFQGGELTCSPGTLLILPPVIWAR